MGSASASYFSSLAATMALQLKGKAVSKGTCRKKNPEGGAHIVGVDIIISL
jgi:hypothetical protein